MKERHSLWTKNFLFISLANLMVFTSFYFLLPTLPVFVVQNLHGDKSEVGSIIGVLSITAVMLRPFSGYLLDTVGRKKVFFISLIGLIIVMSGYNFVTSLVLLLGLRVLHGVFWGFTTTSLSTVAADVVPAARRGEGLGYFGLSTTLAMALGPGLGLFILGRGGFPTLFKVSFGVAIFALIFAVGVTYHQATRTGAPAGLAGDGKRKLTLESLFEPKVFPLAALMFFIAFVYGGIVSFITLFGKEIGIANAGTFFFVYAVTILFIRPFSGKVLDREGPFRIMLTGFAAIAIAFTTLFLAKGLAVFVLAATIMGVGYGIVQPGVLAMAMGLVPDFRRGAANGTVMSAFDLGIGLGSMLLGVVSRLLGLANMYLLSSLIILVPLSMFYFQQKPRASRDTRGQ